MTVDLVVIGLGSAGRTAVEFAAELGAEVVGIDRRPPGGDCLWTGCIPSKALLASARVAHTMRTADRMGVATVEPTIDLDAVWERIRDVQFAVAATDDDPERLRDLGVDIVMGEARVTSPTTVTVDGRRIETGTILIATGSRPIVPAGFEHALTTDSLWSLDRPPTTLQIVGGGSVGCELGQGLHRLGVDVEVLERESSILPGLEPLVVEPVAAAFAAEGLTVRTQVLDSTPRNDGPRLVAVGRSPVVEGLGLEELGVQVGEHGVVVDDQGRTAVPSIFAAGDVTGRPHLTTRAASDATTAVRAMLLPGPASRESVTPTVVFTDPELASVGLTSSGAAAVTDDVEVWTLDVADTDRGRTDAAAGRIALVTGPRQRLLGAHVVAPGAGEVIGELALAIRDGRRLNHLAGLQHAYPTISSGIGTLAARAVRARAGAVGDRARRRAERSNG